MVSRGNGGRIRYQSLPKKSIKGGGGDLIIDYKLTLPMRGKVHMNITKPYRGIKQIISGLSHIPLNPAPPPFPPGDNNDRSLKANCK